jgi:hypothetical protein
MNEKYIKEMECDCDNKMLEVNVISSYSDIFYCNKCGTLCHAYSMHGEIKYDWYKIDKSDEN